LAGEAPSAKEVTVRFIVRNRTPHNVVYLVAGNRVLERTTEAQRWACDLIDARIVAMRGLVVVGGARGPDIWARTAASVRQRPWTEFLPSGVRRRSNGVHDRWSSVPVHPLDRNLYMVRFLVRMRDMGWVPRALILIAPWSNTHGAEHCGSAAKRAGVEVEWARCPAEYGP
jgi:hypothetical protein